MARDCLGTGLACTLDCLIEDELGADIDQPLQAVNHEGLAVAEEAGVCHCCLGTFVIKTRKGSKLWRVSHTHAKLSLAGFDIAISSSSNPSCPEFVDGVQ